ncbi:MAG: LacI family DNA-binding transcriptional regulator [Alphaproteobacteria bacterium]|nr:LacI family DNA-binding transcriptional regulator [Alphaproteobacteria bacterium]MDE2111844.1 LacI family DNA-binding transcriptional regulator [Alphaproteobacteria bacterium]MDE2493584.1 LacI family DNA-binding transcriptional regulator [Alphaproteobacteria bacterium]
MKQNRPAAVSRQKTAVQKPASIYDVAKRAKVSIKTVSRVVNRLPSVGDETRKRVMEAVEALSYRPNVYARGLASERSFLIGLLCDIPAAGSGYIAALQIGMLSRCRKEGYHLIVESVDERNSDLGHQVRSLVAQSRLQGVVLTSPLCDMPAVIEALNNAGTPFVRIAPEKSLPHTIDVRIDDHAAAYDMTTYLIGLGHRRIGFIKGTAGHGDAKARFEGYLAALADGGLPFVEDVCVQGQFTYQSGMEASERLFALKKRPTAIFACNDDMAAAVLATSQRFNLKIPQQLSVAGFDDSLVAQVVWPRLTTCRQPIEEMAQAAMSILTQRSDDNEPFEVRLDHELVVRESTAPPDVQ